MTGLIHFSTDAASNDVAAPPILWQEGQPANTVNNSSREEMAALARWHADTSGGLVATRASSDAYGLATNQILNDATISKPHMLAFTVAAENQGPATLSPDGLPPVPIQRSGGIELAPRDLRPGVLYRVARAGATYTIISPSFAECGMIAPFATATVPAGWLVCDGRALSRASYAALFTRVGTTYGAGDGSTTFNIPDYLGRTIFGADGGTNRLTGAGGLNGTLGSTGGSEVVALTEAQLAAHGHGGSTAGAGGHDHGGSTVGSGSHDHGGSTASGGAHSHSGTTNGGGAHTHSGSTDAAGQHAHGVQYQRLTNYRTDGASGGVNALNAGDGGTNTTGTTDGNGAHSHSVTLTGAPDHAHGFTTGSAGDHAHTIPAVANHAHAIPGVGDHTHALAINAAGSGQGHPNVPPGGVATIAIKA